MAIYGFKVHRPFELQTADGKTVRLPEGAMVRNCGLTADTVTLQVIRPDDPAAAVMAEFPWRQAEEQLKARHGEGAVVYLETEEDFRNAGDAQAAQSKAAPKKKGKNTVLCMAVVGMILLLLAGTKRRQ